MSSTQWVVSHVSLRILEIWTCCWSFQVMSWKTTRPYFKPSPWNYCRRLRILGWIDHGSVLEGHFYVKFLKILVRTFLHLIKLLGYFSTNIYSNLLWAVCYSKCWSRSKKQCLPLSSSHSSSFMKSAGDNLCKST